MAAGGPGRPKTGPGERPYSVSKDEAYARMLQEEEYNETAEEDERMARRMQQDMMLGLDNSTDSDDNQHTATGGESQSERRRKRREERMNQPMHRMMTPITELFTTLVMGSMRQRHPYFFSGEDSSRQEDSDEDTNPVGTTGLSSLNPNTSNILSTPRGTGIGGRPPRPQAGQRARRVSRHHGMRPLETSVQTVEARPGVRSTASRGTITAQTRGTTGRGMVIRGNRNQRTRGTSVRGGLPRRNSSSSQTSDTEVGEIADNTQAPLTMEPSVPPLSLAIQQPELPDGEVEPEIVLLDGGGSDSRFVHIMRDPILLLLFLMGRSPGIMVPDDIDPNDYESLWELAERLGEVKNKGMTDDEMKTLPKKSYSTLVKHKKGEEPACRVCLFDFKKGESVCTLPCKHEYHHKCITEWLKRNASCPICRYELKSC